MPQSHSAATPPTSAKRHDEQDQECLSEVLEGRKKKCADEGDRDRQYNRQSAVGPLLVLELSSPINRIAVGKVQRGCDLGLGRSDETSKIGAAHVGLHYDTTARVFARD